MAWQEESPTAVVSTFKGLNRKYKGTNGEFSDMQNLSSSGYPCMVPRGRRKKLYEGYENIRLFLEPINANKSSDPPAFCGIADNDAGESVLYYNGEKVGINHTYNANTERYATDGTIEQGYEYTGKLADVTYSRVFKDKSVLFPKGAGTQISSCYLNDRLFIFVNNDNDFGDVTELTLLAGQFSGRTVWAGTNTITVIEDITDIADKIINRNVIMHNPNTQNGTDMEIEIKYNVTAVDVQNRTITLNAPICLNPLLQQQTPTGGWTLRPYHDRGIYYYDAGKSGAKLQNAQKGVHNVFADLQKRRTYTDPDTGIKYKNTIKVSDVRAAAGAQLTLTDKFAVSDMLTLSGFGYEVNNTVIPTSKYEQRLAARHYVAQVVGVVTEENAPDSLYIKLYNDSMEEITGTDESTYYTTRTPHAYISITKFMPAMASVCAHDQRLWGVAANGERIYASEYGDPFTFGSASGASGAITIEADTKDEYTGIVDYGQYVVLLKPTSIQQIYALSSASTVQIARAMYNHGCIDIRSAIVIRQTLYYLGYNGFYAYTGSEPTLISDKLQRSYISATAFTDGMKYYASAVTSDGEREFIVYDTNRGYWHKEDDLNALGAYMWYNQAIVAGADGKVWQLNVQSDEVIEWYADTCLMFEGTLDNKILNEIWIRAYVPEGSSVTVYTRGNFSDWREHMTFPGGGDIKVWRVPITATSAEWYQIRIAGTGEAVIYDIERRLAPMEGRQHFNGPRGR